MERFQLHQQGPMGAVNVSVEHEVWDKPLALASCLRGKSSPTCLWDVSSE